MSSRSPRNGTLRGPRSGSACSRRRLAGNQGVEREIDAQLFRRKARGVELTDAGRAFLDNARAVLAQLDQTLEATRRTARGEQGRISVAYSSTVAFHPLVPRVIREFREAFPLVTVTLMEGYPEH